MSSLPFPDDRFLTTARKSGLFKMDILFFQLIHCSLSYIDFCDCRNEVFPLTKASHSSRDTRTRIWSPTIIKGDPIIDSPPIGGSLVRTQRCSIISTRLSAILSTDDETRRVLSSRADLGGNDHRQDRRGPPRGLTLRIVAPSRRRSERAVRIVTTPADRKISARWSSMMTARHLIHICQDGRKAFDRCNSCRSSYFLFSYADILYKQPPTVSFIAEKIDFHVSQINGKHEPKEKKKKLILTSYSCFSLNCYCG